MNNVHSPDTQALKCITQEMNTSRRNYGGIFLICAAAGRGVISLALSLVPNPGSWGGRWVCVGVLLCACVGVCVCVCVCVFVCLGVCVSGVWVFQSRCE